MRPGPAREVSGSERGLLAINHEALTDQFLHAGGTTPNPRPAPEADKEIPAHGVSIIEVRKAGGKFTYQKDSAYNRRITPMTPFQINGPARGSALMKTKFSVAGTDGRGTINNCGTGPTPWGTFLTGEENWAGYFRRGDDEAVRGGATRPGQRFPGALWPREEQRQPARLGECRQRRQVRALGHHPDRHVGRRHRRLSQ